MSIVKGKAGEEEPVISEGHNKEPEVETEIPDITSQEEPPERAPLIRIA